MLYFVMDLEQNTKNQSNIVNKKTVRRMVFCFYIIKSKSANLIISHKPSIYLYSCYINLISQNKSQKSQNFIFDLLTFDLIRLL